jgi:hypothetical protein
MSGPISKASITLALAIAATREGCRMCFDVPGVIIVELLDGTELEIPDRGRIKIDNKSHKLVEAMTILNNHGIYLS